METLVAILKDTEELFRIAKKCPSSELALIMHELGNYYKQQEHLAYHENLEVYLAYEILERDAYNSLSYYGYVPLDF